MNLLGKQVAALTLGIEALKRERRKLYAAGNAAYRQGLRVDKIDGDGIVGNGFQWVEDDHKDYVRYTDAIQELEDMIEVLQDPGVVVNQLADLPLFEEVNNVG